MHHGEMIQPTWPMRNTVSEGVLGFLEMLMISLSLGTPRVTFLADTPA